jgi:hypothetical protein
MQFHITNTPNILVEWLTPLLRIREVPGLNLVPETDYTDFVFFVVFLIPFSQMLEQ